LVVLVEAHLHGGGGVVGLPAPLADGDELQRHAMIGMQAGALAADVELVADADVGGDDQAGGSVGGAGGGGFGGYVVGRGGFEEVGVIVDGGRGLATRGGLGDGRGLRLRLRLRHRFGFGGGG